LVGLGVVMACIAHLLFSFFLSSFSFSKAEGLVMAFVFSSPFFITFFIFYGLVAQRDGWLV
jgi:ABC-type transport system involved in multi-copper enzyme maturation permease subunit